MAKQLSYILLSSVTFLIIHIIVLFLKLNDGLNFIVILAAMIFTQWLAFSNIRTKTPESLNTFSSIFILLAITQLFSVILLTLYSAFDPFGDPKEIHITDML